ncbi:MAG: ATP-binding protein [Opitutales bacterium]|nr:ATP-binding protein [Opitutales bacterium]MCH8540076.1 ATP-binding protein [Opitutales bacterium]
MQQDFGNSLAQLEPLAKTVQEFGQQEVLPKAVTGTLNLALDELFTNIVQHGYAPGEKGQISLQLTRKGDAVEAILQDHAPAYNPFDAPEPDRHSPVESRPIGGLGVHLVKELMDHWEYRRDHHQNTVILRKNLA